jgi:cytoskeletal protein RodZ
LGASLRAARLGRNITLEAVAAHTKINAGFFRDLERDDLSKWPANQFYRESYLRAYAEAVGLDPAEVIDAFRHELVAAGEWNAPAPAAEQRRLTPVTIPIILAVTFVTLYSLARWTAALPEDPAAGGGAQLKLSPTNTVKLSPTNIESAAPPAAVDPVSPARNEVQTTEPAPSPENSQPVDLDQLEGEMVIVSTPPGARVLVNGVARGTTPARVQFLPPGSYTVRFLMPGYSAVMRNATISPERLRARVSATLEPRQPAE